MTAHLPHRRVAGRPYRLWRGWLAAKRNALVRAVQDGNGPFRKRVVPSKRLYRRQAKHRLRELGEVMG